MQVARTKWEGSGGASFVSRLAASLCAVGLLACTAIGKTAEEEVGTTRVEPQLDEEPQPFIPGPQNLSELNPVPPTPRLPAEMPGDARIELRRTACFGNCPVYSVALNAGGDVRYEGISAVAHVGVARAEVDPAEVAEVWGIAASLFSSMKPDAGRRTCSESDIPSTWIELSTGDVRMEVQSRGQCSPYGEYEDSLLMLAVRLDELAGAREWVWGGRAPITDDALRITFDRTACAAGCPESRISISFDGRVEYQADRNAAVPPQRKRTDTRLVASVLRELDKLTASLPVDEHCRRPAQDKGSITITFGAVGSRRTLEDQLGCANDTLEPLRVLERRIVWIARTGG